jgi:hypothetical protein
MILSVICRLICATVPRTHIRFMHSILSFKWSVTLVPLRRGDVHDGELQRLIERPRLRPERPCRRRLLRRQVWAAAGLGLDKKGWGPVQIQNKINFN